MREFLVGCMRVLEQTTDAVEWTCRRNLVFHSRCHSFVVMNKSCSDISSPTLRHRRHRLDSIIMRVLYYPIKYRFLTLLCQYGIMEESIVIWCCIDFFFLAPTLCLYRSHCTGRLTIELLCARRLHGTQADSETWQPAAHWIQHTARYQMRRNRNNLRSKHKHGRKISLSCSTLGQFRGGLSHLQPHYRIVYISALLFHPEQLSATGASSSSFSSHIRYMFKWSLGITRQHGAINVGLYP